MLNSLGLKKLLKLVFNQLIRASTREIKDEDLEYVIWLTNLYLQLGHMGWPLHILQK